MLNNKSDFNNKVWIYFNYHRPNDSLESHTYLHASLPYAWGEISFLHTTEIKVIGLHITFKTFGCNLLPAGLWCLNVPTEGPSRL